MALTRGVAGDEIQCRPVAGPGALHFFFGEVTAIAASMDQRAIGLGFDQPVLQVAWQQWWRIEARTQGGQRFGGFTDVFLELAARVDQVVLRFDQFGFGEVAASGRLVDVGDGAGPQFQAPFRRGELFVEGVQLGLGQGDGFAGQEHIEIAFGQAHRGVLALGIEYRIAVVGTLLTLAVLGHLLFVEQRLAQAHVGALGVVMEISVDVVLALSTIDLVVVGRGVDLR
ncbi:hypothetical protein D3C71_1487970 [compost metagenome]